MKARGPGNSWRGPARRRATTTRREGVRAALSSGVRVRDGGHAELGRRACRSRTADAPLMRSSDAPGWVAAGRDDAKVCGPAQGAQGGAQVWGQSAVRGVCADAADVHLTGSVPALKRLESLRQRTAVLGARGTTGYGRLPGW